MVPQRLLATAIDDPVHDISFDRMQSAGPAGYQNSIPPPPLYTLRPFDPAQPLHLRPQVDNLPRTRATPHGVPGGVEEMFSVFDACLLVDKLDRAALVLERFTNMDVVSGSELIVLHNRYLRANLDQVFKQSKATWASAMHRWYELHIRNKQLPQTPETIACMLKVSLLSSQGERLERLVKRYLDMMPDEESIYHVLSEEDILTQQDLGTIISIYQPASRLSLEEIESSTDDTFHQQTQQGDLPTTATISEDVTASRTAGPTPQVLGTEQKGLGLNSLRGVLSFFKDIEDKDLSTLPLAERREIQARLERDCVDAAISRWREEHQALRKIGRASATQAPALNSQLYDWHTSLEAKIVEEFASLDAAEEAKMKTQAEQDRCAYGPFLRQSTPTRLAAITILSVLNTIVTQGADKGVTLATALQTLSKAVEDDVKFSNRTKEIAEKKRLRRRQFRQQVAAQAAGGKATEDNDLEKRPVEVKPPLFERESWPTTIRTKVAAILISALIDSAKVNVVREHPDTKALVSQIQPAMAHTTIHKKGKKVGVILPNKFLTDMMKREPRGDFLARHLPMLVEPEPWSAFDKGGFLGTPSALVRVKNGEREQRIYTNAAAERGDLEQVMKGLDVLGRTGWRINNPVFDVMLEAWNSGEEVANIPALQPEITIPPEPEASEDANARREWLKAVKAADNKRSGLHSERCFMNFQLEIARSFRNQTFYFPHNMDFRGRAYPLPTYLNHMGADNVRGLLKFSEGKALGEAGLRWLKVHLSNVFGYDKASLKEREQFTVDHHADIVDSATSPLTGQRWWLQAEDPWQCLAACFELKAALDSPDPTMFVSHLPVHQDGTCNGLQHYAALGGDTWGAQQVNLEPGDRPADVYSAVANLVKESIAADIKDENVMALALDGKVTRKVVKQTVMTNVYGVTFMGAKAQIQKQLDAAYPRLFIEHGIPVPLLASYLATKVFKALSTMFRGAHDIQFWLGECAGRVCRALTPEQLDRLGETKDSEKPKGRKLTMAAKLLASKKRPTNDELLDHFRSTIVWTTPLRMPIAQPYRKTASRCIETCLQDLNLQVPERTDPVHRRKQLQAFPPNFIHSLDASHMLLSALECDERGLSFAAVHDSFWTHAADIDTMNVVLRDSFIRIHGEDVIGRLASEFEARYRGSLYLTTVERGSPLGKQITALRKESKLNMREELLREYKRTKLLASSDPFEMQEAQKMVTPAVLFERAAAQAPIESTAEMQEVGLGSIPGSTQPEDINPTATPEDDSVEHYKELMEMSNFELTMANSSRPGKDKARQVMIQLWLPLTFPPIPEKGDFNVERLRDSKYFFS